MEIIRNNNSVHGFGVAGLVLGIFALLFAFIPCLIGLAFILGVLSIIFGSIALSKSTVMQSSRNMGIAGLTLGAVAVLIIIAWTLLFAGFRDKFKNIDNIDSFFEWFDHVDSYNGNIDDAKAASLEELEKALDDLEGTLDDVSQEVDSVNSDINKKAKDAVNKAKNKVKDTKD